MQTIGFPVVTGESGFDVRWMAPSRFGGFTYGPEGRKPSVEPSYAARRIDALHSTTPRAEPQTPLGYLAESTQSLRPSPVRLSIF